MYPKLKQGICKMNVMVDFICVDLAELLEHEPSETYKMKNSCPQLDSNPQPSDPESFVLRITFVHHGSEWWEMFKNI